MTGIGWGIGSPVSQFGQGTASGYGGYPIGTPFLQTSPYLQSFQQIPASYGIGVQPFGMQAQALQQLLQILPQQLGQLHQLLQHQVQGLQQLVQVVPQQLHHIQQLLQVLPQQIHQLQAQTQQQPFGSQATPGFSAYGPWQQPGVGISSPAFTGQGHVM